jgi:cytochrome c nitrite reductase small subunit
MEPLGWWGTTEGWARAIGLVFAGLDVVLILSCWVHVKRGGVARGFRERLAVALGLLPLTIVFAAYSYALPESKRVDACGACHVMDPFIKDLRDPKSDTLAALHHQNPASKGEECFACHSDYGLWGDMSAKLHGLGHIYHLATGTYTLPIRIRTPFPSTRCLSCHGQARRYLTNAAHADVLKDLAAGKAGCLDCHSSVHPAPETRGPAAAKASVVPRALTAPEKKS